MAKITVLVTTSFQTETSEKTYRCILDIDNNKYSFDLQMETKRQVKNTLLPLIQGILQICWGDYRGITRNKLFIILYCIIKLEPKEQVLSIAW